MSDQLGTSRGTVFVGRRAQLAVLSAARDDSTRDGLTVCVVTGEPGVGRTALLDAFSADSRALGAVVRLAGRRRDRRGPTALLDDLIGGLAARHPDADTMDADTMTATLAALRRAALDGPRDVAPDAPEPLGTLVAAVRDAVIDMTRQAPLVVTVDDANQAGAGCAALLHRVLEGCSDLPVVVAASLRPDGPGAVAPELAELLYGARQVPLDGLSTAETARLLSALLGVRPPAGLVSECHRLTEGNPFMLVELARWVLAGPRGGRSPSELRAAVLPAIARSILDRVGRSDPNAKGLLEVIAVVGDRDGADPSLLTHLSGIAQPDALRALDTLVRMRIVTDDDAVALRHPLLRQAVVAATTRMARNAVHLATAAHLHQRGAPVDRIAEHLVASTVAPTGEWPVGVLRRAARSARRDEDALRYLELAVRAASGAERGQAALELVDARLRLDRTSGLDSAVASLAQAPDDPTRRGLLARIASVLHVSEGTEDERRVLHQVAMAVDGTGYQGWPDLYRQLSTVLHSRPAEAVELAERLGAALPSDARDAAAELGAPVNAVSALCLHLLGRDAREALRRARWALDRGLDALALHPLALAAALIVLVDAGQHDEAADRVRRLHGPARRLPAQLRAGLSLAAGRIALLEGDLNEAGTSLASSLEGLPARAGESSDPVRASGVALLADVLVSRGERAQAFALLRRHRYTGELSAAWYHQDVLLARARLRAAEGDLPAAARDLTEWRVRNTELGLPQVGSVLWRMHGAALLHHMGQHDEAVRLACDQVQFADGTGSPRERGRALRVLGWVVGGTEGERVLCEAIALLEAGPDGWDLAQAYGDLGRLLTRSGRPEEAVAALAEAVGLVGRCGAVALGEQLRQQLLAAGEHTAHRVSLRGVLSLTRRERQILLDAARGLTNKGIATTHRITRRTVELHLSSAYRKLDITGREDFSRVFRDPGVWALLTDGAATVRRRARASRACTSAARRPSLGSGRDVPAPRREPH